VTAHGHGTYRQGVIAVLRVLALAALQVGVTFAAAGHQAGHRTIDAFGVGLLVAGPVALLALRRQTWIALGVPLAAAVTWFGLDYPGGPVPAAFGIAVVFCAVTGRRTQAWVAVGVAVLCIWAGWFAGGVPLGQTLGSTAWALVLVTLADHVRARRETAMESRHARVEEERRQVSDERLRIARELHDVLAHNMSLISVQAGVALHLMDTKPDQVRTSLETIRDASRNTMAELRATVGALRSAEEDAPLRPLPGLDGLEGLTRGMSAAGVEVRTTVTGERRPLPAGVDLAAYRIVQEALTNVARHAGTTVAEVHVDYGASVLTVRVVDAGAGCGPVAPGNGLTGMRERATALGGRLVASPRAEGGFAVEAELPVDR
jgi:signal transduction histidine kinase